MELQKIKRKMVKEQEKEREKGVIKEDEEEGEKGLQKKRNRVK